MSNIQNNEIALMNQNQNVSLFANPQLQNVISQQKKEN